MNSQLEHLVQRLTERGYSVEWLTDEPKQIGVRITGPSQSLLTFASYKWNHEEGRLSVLKHAMRSLGMRATKARPSK